MQKKTSLTCFVFMLSILLSGCSKGDDQNGDQEASNPPTEPQIIMSVSEASLTYGYFEDTHSFFIINEGNVPFDWDWSDSSSNSFLSASPSSGTLSVGASVEVTLTVDRSTMITQIYNIGTNINNSDEQSVSLAVEVSNYKEEKWLIEGSVVDAEYDRINDVMIVVSEGPNEIRKFNFANNTVESLTLNVPPKCVSIGQGGNHAAVGNNGTFTYVNLMTMEIENNYPVTADVFDIVLAPNGWVYAFPRDGQWEKIRCVNLTSGIETLQTGNSVREQTKAKLHPSGNYIYGADTTVSPSDFEKYDISGGTAQYLYDSPYHGDFSFSGDIWIADDGNRLFAKSRNVFNVSSSQANDMTYNGELDGANSNVIQTMDFSTNANRVYTVFKDGFSTAVPSNKVKMYNVQFLAYLGEIELPDFITPNGTNDINFYDSHGYFGFFNSDGSKFFVLVKIEEGSGIQNEWAIATINVQ